MGGGCRKVRAHPDGPVYGNAVSVHMFIDQKIDETAARGVRPEIPA